MKYLILISLLALTSCSASYEDKTGEYSQLPEELKNCKIYYISSKDDGMRVMHCPKAETTVKYNCGKNCTRTNTVISE
jgi:hypothetical protein